MHVITRRRLNEFSMSTLQIEKALKAWPQVKQALYVPRNEREYRQLVKLLDRLIDEVGEDEQHPLASLMEVIGVLVEKFEDEHVPELT
jgi:HTH-type transcriptional regulator/antitoxin HigA